jgi:hypothetical protein
MKKTHLEEHLFVICINNKYYPASLEFGKIYRIIPDSEAEKHGYFRVIDESGEDYAYASDRFFPIELPQKLEKVFLSASRA